MIISIQTLDNLFLNQKFASLRLSKPFFTFSNELLHQQHQHSASTKATATKMLKQNGAECQFAINIFKATEMSMKKLLGLLEKTVEQKMSFQSLSLIINKIKGQEADLKNLSKKS